MSKNSSALSQGDALPSEQSWHRGHPPPRHRLPIPKPLHQIPPQPSPPTHPWVQPHMVRRHQWGERRGRTPPPPSLLWWFSGRRGGGISAYQGASALDLFNCELVEFKETLSGRLPHRKLLRRI